MDTELSMNRLIHAAVRRDLVRIERGLRTLPDGDRARAQQLQETWDNFQAQLTRHHEGEDTHVWPWLKSVGVDPDLLAEMESEHEGLARALRECAQAIRVASSTARRADAQSAADVVARARGVVEQHLQHEEAELEPLLRPQMGTPGWKAVEKKLRRASPVTAGWFFAWMQDGATREELERLRTFVPGPVLFVLSRVFGRGYTKQVAAAWS